MLNIIRKVIIKNENINTKTVNNDCCTISINQKYLSYVIDRKSIGLIDYSQTDSKVCHFNLNKS